MTSDRPYRPALSWATAGKEVLAQSAAQFDPGVVRAFVEREDALQLVRSELAA
jgi:HD-GYP domain-containing protein (c-di-GMP phosphodiesterase class II)